MRPGERGGRRTTAFRTCVLALWLGATGCVSAFSLGQDDAGPSDAGPSDAGPSDAGRDAGTPPAPSCPAPATLRVQTFPDQPREAMMSRIADMDGDGAADAMWANQLDQTITLWFGDGAGGFPGRTSLSSGRLNYFDVGDIDGDGDLDLVATNQDLNRITFIRGEGGRAFAAPVAIRQTGFPTNIALIDVDDDGDLDMLLNLRVADCFAVRLNDGTGSFADRLCLAGLWGSTAWAVGDLDGDGREELAALQFPDARIDVFEFEAGAMRLARSTPLSSEFSEASHVALDQDGDGRDELAVTVARPDGGRVETWFASYDADFGVTFCDAPYATGEVGGFGVTYGQLDGDGRPDAIGQTTCSFCASTYFVHTTR